MGPTNRWSDGCCRICLTEEASLDGIMVKLLSIILGMCGTPGLDILRAGGVIVVIAGITVFLDGISADNN